MLHVLINISICGAHWLQQNRQYIQTKMALHQELTPSEVKELLEAFSLFDKDNDGALTSGEFRAVLAALGYSENDTDTGAILKRADLNGDGVLTFPEYERLIRDHVMPLKVMEKQARDIFRAFDKGKKGFMDEQDFRRFLIAHGQKSTEEDMYCRFESLDKMGSGRLSVKDVTPTIRQILFES